MDTRVGRALTDHTGEAVRWSLAVLIAALVAVLISLGLSRVPWHEAAGRAALETGTAVFALGGAWMLRSQFSCSRCLHDLLVVGALLVVGLTDLCVGAIPAVLGVHSEHQFAAANLLSDVIAGGVLAAAAFVPAKRLIGAPSQPLVITTVLSGAAVTVAGFGNVMLQTHPVVAGASDPAAAPAWPPAAGVLALASAGLLIVAAGQFLTPAIRRAGNAGMAISAILLASACLEPGLSGALSEGGRGASEFLSFAAIMSLVLVTARREVAMRSQVAKAAALAARHRVASDLHDGLAQDLAFIAAYAGRVAEDFGEDHPLVIAARRALAISREKISELSDPSDATVYESLDAVAQELRDRFEIAVAVDVQLDRDLSLDVRENVARIAREAIANAARHGGARNVVVELKAARSGIALRVIDDGCGLRGKQRDAESGGFGLRSMRDRTIGLGGHLSIREPPTGGTEIEAVFP